MQVSKSRVAPPQLAASLFLTSMHPSAAESGSPVGLLHTTQMYRRYSAPAAVQWCNSLCPHLTLPSLPLSQTPGLLVAVSFTEEHTQVCCQVNRDTGNTVLPSPCSLALTQMTTPGTSSVPSTSALSSVAVPLSSAKGTGRLWKALWLCAVFMSVYTHYSLNGQRSVKLLIHEHLCHLWPLQMRVHPDPRMIYFSWLFISN